MTSFGSILLTAFFVSVAVGLAIFIAAVRAGYRIWPIWLAGLAVILVVAWAEGSSMGIPWGRLAGEGVTGSDAGGIGLAVFFLVFWTAAALFGWSLAALTGNLFKPDSNPTQSVNT
jgi:hypothetical protein